MSEVIIADREAVHGHLYKAHWKMSDAAKQIHEATVMLYKAGLHTDTRDQLSAVLVSLEGVRDQILDALFKAQKTSQELKTLTGCDGSCSETKK